MEDRCVLNGKGELSEAELGPERGCACIECEREESTGREHLLLK